jgi:hypothetical protein
VESTVVEVLIVKDLGENGFYEVVTWVGLKILRKFEGPRGGGAWLAGHRQERCPNRLNKCNILLLFVKNKL